MLQFSLIVPESREEEIKAKLTRLVDWFMDKEKLKLKDIYDTD